MDVFTLLMHRLDMYLTRIRELYFYILQFFLPTIPDYDDEEYEPTKRGNKVTI